MKRWIARLVCALMVVTLAGALRAAESAGPVLRSGQRLCVAGDSITEQKLYSRFIETYVTVCVPGLQDVRVVQLGWGGETARGFAGRMENDLLGFKPDVVTTSYGMNDGGYRAYEPGIGKPYEDAMRDIVTRLTKAGAKVVVGGPGAVDLTYFHGGGEAANVYNENLRQLGEIARKLAGEAGQPFADVHGALIDAMGKARAALGNEYDVCGRDGVHPQANGHLLMAYAYLKAMGFDGQVGTVTVDMNGAAAATDGHRVVTGDKGQVEMESSRYPFCFTGDDKASGGTRSILPFAPFNQDLNRFVLVVRNLPWDKAKVTWGGTAKTFAKADLEKGVNLAAEFLQNPFCEAFQKVDNAVGAKQAFETTAIKSCITFLPRMRQATEGDAEGQAALEAIRTRLWEKQAKLAADVRALAVPVKHTLTVTADTP